MIKTDEFFESPRSWSILKYKVLDGYLRAYFPKVNQQYMCAAVAADLFAGRGRFENGADGSPIIIARHAKLYADRFRLKNKVVLAEASVQDREMLSEKHEGIHRKRHGYRSTRRCSECGTSTLGGN